MQMDNCDVKHAFLILPQNCKTFNRRLIFCQFYYEEQLYPSYIQNLAYRNQFLTVKLLRPKMNQRTSYDLADFVPMIDLDEIYLQDT